MPRYATRDVLEDYRAVDVRTIAKQGALAGGRHCLMSWSRANRVTDIVVTKGRGASVDILSLGSGLHETVWLDWTPVYFGGMRAWFLCPDCSRRVAILYNAARFRCRHCLGLMYSSQREDGLSRAISRAQRIRLKLGGSADLSRPFPGRPKWMHKKTYRRLCGEAQAATAVMSYTLMRWLPTKAIQGEPRE